MSDSTDAPQVESEEGQDGATPPAESLGDGGVKALEAERKARREAERTTKELQARLAELESAELRRDVASDRGLTPAQAKHLAGSTREELEASADELVEAFGTRGATPPPSRRPVGDLRGGTDPTDVSTDVGSIADQIMRRSV